MDEDGCKQVPYQSFIKIRGNDRLYQEALEAVTKFNRRLVVERKTRIPFIDNQTRVAQTNSSFLWYKSYDREPGYKANQVYSYPLKTWVKKRRIQLEQDTNSIRQQTDIQSINENSNSMDTGSSLGIKNQSVNDLPIPVQQQQQQQQNHLVHQQQLQLHHQDWQMEDESFDNTKDDDDESDYDDYEETKKKKSKKGKRGASKKEIPLDEKPHVCSHCGAKYKTKPGLTYHVSKMHTDGNTNGNGGDATPSLRGPQKPSELEGDNSTLDSAHDENSNSAHHRAPQTPQQQTQLHTISHQSNNLVKFAIANHINNNVNGKICINCGFGPEVDKNQMVPCSECHRSFHPICLSFTPNMIVSVKKYKWQCIDCKKCTICGNSENDDKLLFCDDCDRGYHMYCLNPPLNEAPEGDWRCEKCVIDFGPQ